VSISSPAGSLDLVNLTLLRESVEHLVMSVTSGGNAPGLQANLDLAGQSGRTSPACSPPSAGTSSAASSVTWPRWGMWSDGQLSALSMWERRTAGIESSSSAMMPTPQSRDHKGANQHKNAATGSGSCLPNFVKMWPTPTTNDSKNATLPPSQLGRNSVIGELQRQGITGSLNPTWVEWLMGYETEWTVCEP
jgi:hypothetical protein